jgi:hypothetical protein
MRKNNLIIKITDFFSPIIDNIVSIFYYPYQKYKSPYSKKEIEYFEELRERKQRNHVASRRIVRISGNDKKKKPKRFIYKGVRLKYGYDWDGSMNEHRK